MCKPAKFLSISLLIVTTLLLAGLADALRWLWDQELASYRGVSYGVEALVTDPLADVVPYGVNVYFDGHTDEEIARSLSMIQSVGLRWIRVHLPWRAVETKRNSLNWSVWDRRIDLCRQHGLQVILVVTGTPAWARQDPLPTAPPDDAQTYASFLAAAVRHYQGRVRCFQVWDDPNIAPHWGTGHVDPAAYTALLQAAYAAAKEADPACVILSAGLAPNWETGGENLNELDFLRRMYRAGAKDHFDVLGAKPYGFWETPEDPRLSPDVLNFSRLFLQREIMEEFGDHDTPIWAVSFGWNALPADWAGRPSIWGSDEEDKQAQRTLAAMRRVRMEWPWLGVMTLACFRWAGDPADPIRGFAMVDADFTPRKLYTLMDQALHAPPVATPGVCEPANPAIGWESGWQVKPDEGSGTIAVGSAGMTTTILFLGTRLDAVTRGGTLNVALDGRPPTRVDLGQSGDWRNTPLVHGASDTLHRADIQVAAGYVDVDAFLVVREKPLPPYGQVIALLLAALVVNLLWLFRRLRRLPRPTDWLARHPRASAILTLAGMLLALAWYQWVPGDVLSLLGLGVLIVLTALRPTLYLSLVAVTAPFYLSLWRFASITEVLILVGGVAWALRSLWRRDWRALLPRRTDLPVLFFVAVGVLSLAAAEYRGVALRELRTVVVEPALLFALVTRAVATRRDAARVVDGLILAGALAAAWGLGQFVLGQDVITTEGVWRVRAAYPSPNNLGLFLGRTLPLAVALALSSGSGWRRRWLYALAAVVTGLGLVLTFSRGAWLAVAVALLFLGALRGFRALLFVVGALVAGLLALVPLGHVERISSLFDLEEGTSFLRLKLWQASIRMALDHPLQGVGLDNFLYQYPRYRLPEAWEEPDLSHPHNIVLDWWLRLGALGLLALAVLLVDFFRRASRSLRAASLETRSLVLGLTASMADALVHGLIDNSYFLVDLAVVFMLSYGVVVVLDQSPKPKSQAPKPNSIGEGVQSVEAGDV